MEDVYKPVYILESTPTSFERPRRPYGRLFHGMLRFSILDHNVVEQRGPKIFCGA